MIRTLSRWGRASPAISSAISGSTVARVACRAGCIRESYHRTRVRTSQLASVRAERLVALNGVLGLRLGVGLEHLEVALEVTERALGDEVDVLLLGGQPLQDQQARADRDRCGDQVADPLRQPGGSEA